MFAGEHRGTHSARLRKLSSRRGADAERARAVRSAAAGGRNRKDNLSHQQHLQEVFGEFPDSEFLLRQQGLALATA